MYKVTEKVDDNTFTVLDTSDDSKEPCTAKEILVMLDSGLVIEGVEIKGENLIIKVEVPVEGSTSSVQDTINSSEADDEEYTEDDEEYTEDDEEYTEDDEEYTEDDEEYTEDDE